jgi:uncharacterized membrane protein
VSAEAPASLIRVADVRAGQGPRWIAEAFRIYRAQPLVWSALSLGWIVMSFGLLLVPIVGGIAVNLLQPVFFASFAITARKQLRGERVEMGDLFLGFRANLKALVNVGMVELGAAFVIVLAFTIIAGPIAAPVEAGATPTSEDLARMIQDKGWYIFAALLLVCMIKGALWFAPPLIAFHGLSAMHAIRWSIYASLSNAGAMVAYFLALALLYLAAALPWGLGFIIVLPMMVLSTFTGYRDVFEREETGSPPPDNGTRGQAPRS